MANELLILRHAKSDWNQNCDDFERPLNGRGARDAPRIGAWLAAQKLTPDHILSSPARRARQTTEAVCAGLRLDFAAVQWNERLYLASVPALLRELAGLPPGAQRVLLVGHNPGLEELLLYLAQPPVPRKDNGKLLTTATLAHLRMESGWAALPRGRNRLLNLIYPRELAAP